MSKAAAVTVTSIPDAAAIEKAEIAWQAIGQVRQNIQQCRETTFWFWKQWCEANISTVTSNRLGTLDIGLSEMLDIHQRACGTVSGLERVFYLELFIRAARRMQQYATRHVLRNRLGATDATRAMGQEHAAAFLRNWTIIMEAVEPVSK